MISNLEPIKNWFGFNRRERRSSFIMLLVIIIIIGLRYTIPDKRIDIEDITASIMVPDMNGEADDKNSFSTSKPFSSELTPGTKSIQRQLIKKYIPQKSPIDINTCDSATLVQLPGIGPVLSVRIIKYRRLLGGFARIEQLKEVYGLPPETFELIKGRIFTDSTMVTKININSAGYKELSRLPYFEKYEVTAILKYREIKGKISAITDLTDNKLITMEKACKVSPYLKFGE
jgi:DNA uptake protein ComE-like DNA-binding protein